MARWIYASSLTVGRCFYIAPPDDEPALAPTEPGGGARTLMAPDRVYRVDVAGDTVTATSAMGAVTELPGTTRVHEVPRAGFDKLRASTRPN